MRLPSLKYSHHIPSAYIPQYYTTSLITLQNCNCYPDESGYDACPSKLPDTGGGGEEFMTGGGGTVATMLSKVNAINEKIDEMHELVAAEGYTAEDMESGDIDYADDLAFLASEKEILLKEAVNLYVQEGKTDSAIIAMAAEDASWVKERIVELHIINADLEAAITALNEVNTDEPSGADFVALYEIMIPVAQDGRNILQLSKEELSALESFAGKQSPSGVVAENILEFAAGGYYPELFDAEVEDEDLRYAPPQSDSILIYPNLSTNELFIQINNESIAEGYFLEMYSITGTHLLTGSHENQGLNVLHLNNIPSGIYLIRVHANGLTKQIEKIIKE